MTTADEMLRQYLSNGEMAQYNEELLNPRGPGKRAILAEDVDRQRKKRNHKYNAKPTEIDGIRFDSKREAQRYQELKMLTAAGEIHSLQLQPRFELQPSFKRNGKTVRAIHYVADFQYVTQNGRHVVEDTKGMATAVFKLKKKLFLYRYPDLELRVTK